ncbi:MAG TPA: tetratricopeptide repeat protein [Terriglobales bacterium]
MKRVADETADPLLAKLEKQPNNAKLLVQVGNVYKAAHQFKQAAGYYGQSLKIDPANVTIRTEMASCLYYTGNVDGALSELQHSLRDRPKDANSLFNLGMIKWRGKNDPKGAVMAWRQLLKSNPNLEQDKKATVEKLIADATQVTVN